MASGLDLGVAGAVRPWPGSIPQSFSLWFPRWCVAPAWFSVPPFWPTVGSTRRAYAGLSLGALWPPRKAQYDRAVPARTGVFTGASSVCASVLFRCCAALRLLPISFPFLFPAGEEKAQGPHGGPSGPQRPCGGRALAPPGRSFGGPSAVRLLIVAVAVKAKTSAAGRALRGSARSAAALTAPHSQSAARQKGVVA